MAVKRLNGRLRSAPRLVLDAGKFVPKRPPKAIYSGGVSFDGGARALEMTRFPRKAARLPTQMQKAARQFLSLLTLSRSPTHPNRSCAVDEEPSPPELAFTARALPSRNDRSGACHLHHSRRRGCSACAVGAGTETRGDRRTAGCDTSVTDTASGTVTRKTARAGSSRSAESATSAIRAA